MIDIADPEYGDHYPQVPGMPYGAGQDQEIGPLHFACIEGSIEKVKTAFSRGTPIHKNEEGLTAMHIAVMLGHSEIVRYFLRVAPEIATIPDPQENTPLDLAHKFGRTDIVQLLA